MGQSCIGHLWDTLVGATKVSKSQPPRLQNETSSKTHTSSLQSERFVRDFLQKSRVNPPKRAFRSRLPPKVTCQSLQSELFVRDFLQKSSGNPHRSTHIKQPCKAASRFQPLQTTPAHAPIPMSLRHSPPPQRNLTIPCACHATSRFPALATQLHASLRLPRKSSKVSVRLESV